MKTLRLASLFLILFYGLKFTLNLKENSSPEVTDFDSSPAPVKKKLRNPPSNRAPASVQTFKNESRLADSTYSASNRNDSLFKGYDSNESPSSSSSSSEDDSTAGGVSISSADAPLRPTNVDNSPAPSGRSPAQTAATSAPNAMIFSGPQGMVPTRAAATPSAPATAPTNSAAGVPSTTSTFNCSATIGAGTYSNPINVALNCSSAATVRYCLAENTCCDPTTGTTYVSAVGVGAEAKTYCLSYMGEASSGQITTVYEHYYTFNPSTPNIQVSADKVVYQTTQLEGKSSFTSTDFGTANLSAGVLNLKNNDPGAATCDDMINNSVAPYVVMPLTSVSGLTSSQQIDVTLPKSTMDYGDNFFVNYLSHTLYAGVYGCSVKKITLEDFPYFEENPANSVLNGSVLEFSGSFTAVGFFEDAPTQVYRGPAGSSTEVVSGQELRTGLFSIFH